MSLLILSIKFGAAAPFEVSERTKELYAHLKAVFYIGESVGDQTLRVVPVASEHSLSEKAFVELIAKPIVDVGPTHVLFDIGGPDEKDIVRYNIQMGLALAITRLLKDTVITFGLFFPLPLDDADVCSPLLQKLAEDRRVRILFGDGNCWGKYFNEVPPPSANIVHWLKSAQVSQLDLLERKLIRRVGYYELQGSGQKLWHYYDGQKASSEIYSLALAYLRKQAARRHIAAIRIDARNSHWFFEPIFQAVAEAGFSGVAEKLKFPEDQEKFGPGTVILLPIVRTGQTIAQLLSKYDGDELPRVWSLLSTEGSIPRDNDRPIPIGNADTQRSILVRYELRVEASNKKLSEMRRRSEVPPVDPETEKLGGKLTSDAMWIMILEAGMIPETPVPPHRLSLGYVPDFGEVAQRNGPLIAAKLEAMLNKTFGPEIAPQLAFLCPDEPKAVRLAKSLQALAGHDTIHVPRSIIGLYDKHGTRTGVEAALATLVEDRDITVAAFQKADRNLSLIKDLTVNLPEDDRPHVVLLDEFGYSGSTLRGLFKLANDYGLRILCSVSLASLSDRNLHSTPTQALSLYSLEYPTI